MRKTRPVDSNDVFSNHRVDLDIAAIIHELREPVHAAHSFLSVLLQERAGPLNELQRDFLTTAIQATKRLSRRTEDLRLVATTGQGLPLRLKEINLVEQIESCIRELKQYAAEFGVSMTLRSHMERLQTSCPAPLADPDRLDQALLNILENAIFYSRQGSVIDVNAVRIRSGAWGVIVRNPVDHLLLEDTSSWHIPFQRDQYAVSKHGNGNGLGLGLTVVDRVISAHNGVVQTIVCGDVVSVGFIIPASSDGVPVTIDQAHTSNEPIESVAR